MVSIGQRISRTYIFISGPQGLLQQIFISFSFAPKRKRGKEKVAGKVFRAGTAFPTRVVISDGRSIGMFRPRWPGFFSTMIQKIFDPI